MRLEASDSEAPRLSAVKRKLFEKYLGGKLPVDENPALPISPRPANVPAPLSFSQEQVWDHCQFAGNVPLYNEPITIYRRGLLNVSVLERCLVELILRHEALRTTFDVVAGRPVQIVHPSPGSFPLAIADLRHREEPDREQEAARLATEQARKRFDLKNGPLFRAILITLADDDHRLDITFHQLIVDAFSAYRVLLPELMALYEAFSAGQPSPLPNVSVQYADYAYWQRKVGSQNFWSKRLELWTKKFSGDIPPLQWPSERPRPAVQSHRGAIQKFSLASDLLHSLRAFCQREGVSPYMALVSAFAAVLHRYSGQQEFVLGSLSAGRKRPEVEKTFGYFVNPFALRLSFSRAVTFRELVHIVRQEVLEGLAHDDLPFERVVRALEIPPDRTRNPLFQIILSMQPQLAANNGEWNVTTEEVSSGGSKLDLMVVMDDRGDTLFGPITFNPDLFEAETISQMIADWQRLLDAAIAEPNRRLSELPILADAARPRVLSENHSMSKAKKRLLEKWVEGRLADRPEAPLSVTPRPVDVPGEAPAPRSFTAWQMQVVKYTPEHFDALCQFVGRVGLNLSLAHAPFVEHYYVKQDWCRLYLAVGSDGTILATYGLEIAQFEYNNTVMAMGLSSNFYSTRPGAGLFLFGCANDVCPVRLIFGGTTDTHKMFRDLKWKYYAGMKIYVLNRSYKAYPGDNWFRVAAKSMAQRVARSKLSRFASRLPSDVCEQVSVREERAFTEDLLPDRSPFAFRFAPSVEYLNWRYNTALSFVRYRVFRILNNGQTAGYVVINEMPDKILVAHCDGTDAQVLAYGVLRSILEVGREDRVPRSVLLATCHQTMRQIYVQFGFRAEPEDRPFYIGTVNGNVAMDGDTSKWLINYDWGDNGLRLPFLDQRPAIHKTADHGYGTST